LQFADAVGLVFESGHRGKKELYRQLKFAMERQGDQVSRLEFKRNELNCYRLELKQFGLFYKVSDQLILWLNQSNDYGFNWLKPSLLLFVFTLIIYILMAIGINPDINWSFDPDNFESTIQNLNKGLYNYFTLLNPAHRITDLFLDIDRSNFGSWFYFIDFLSRIIVSYLLFQTITAFRKYIT
jgi:hypothetical protein